MIPQNAVLDADGTWHFPVSRRALPKRDAALAKITEREQRKLPPGTGRGDAILPATLLQKKLGKTTFRVWCVLLTMRDSTCETHPSLRGLSKATGIREPQLRKSLGRLAEFKLIENFGLMYRSVPCKCETHGCWHKVYVRNVYGWLKASADLQEQSALVPRATARLVKEAAGQGGARKGAGRPKGVKDSAPREIIKGSCEKSKVAPYKYQELVSYVVLSEQQRNAPNLARVVSCDSPDHLEGVGVVTPASQTEGVSMPIPTQRQSDEPTQPILSAAPDALDELTPDDSALDALLSVPEDCREFTWSGTGAPRIQRYTPDDMRAATALSNQITELRVPAPPRIRAESSENERLDLLSAAYKAAHEKVMRREYWRPRGQKQSDKERQALLQAAEALRVEEINPTAWARFCFHRWHQLGKTGAPSQRWVWNSANVHELAGWCHSSTGSQHTNQPVPLPAVKELIYRLGKLREALGYGRPTDVVVSEVLPDRDRQRLMREQAQQVEQGKRDIEQRIRHGEWVWG